VKRALACLALLLALGCVSSGEDSDSDRPKAEERAKKYCVSVAKGDGFVVKGVGRAAKVGDKRYELKLRVVPKQPTADGQPAPETHLLCRYDDRAREARLD